MAAQAKYVGKTAEKGDYVTGADQSQADIGGNTEWIAFPQGDSADISAQAHDQQANQENDNLYDTDHLAAIHSNQSRVTANQENDKTTHGDR